MRRSSRREGEEAILAVFRGRAGSELVVLVPDVCVYSETR